MTETITQESATRQEQRITVPLGSVEDKSYKYDHLLPYISRDQQPPLLPFDHEDPGLRALSHPDPRQFLKDATAVTELTPWLGTEIKGVSLAKLDNDGRDELALEVARRGLLVFRDQADFIDRDPEAYLEWGRYFGRLHIHPTSAHPKGYPEIHLAYRDASATYNMELEDSTTSVIWHSDVSYELQPPGLTTFFLLSQPDVGGDTLFISQVSVLKKLSPSFVAFLRTLKVVHSGVAQADFSRKGKRGGVVRREPIETIHPLVRKHPVTGEEALYVNRQFTKNIVGFKRQESDAILEFLYDHIQKSADLQARVKWQPDTVILWDNRITAHTAIVDYEHSKQRRHGARVAAQAERPIPSISN